MKFKLHILLASLIGLTTSTPLVAEDIELYVNHNVETDEKPRVLIIFDTSGSMKFSTATGDSCGSSECSDSRMSVAKAAMTSLVTENKDIEFGLMRFYSSYGGYILSGLGTEHKAINENIDALVANGSTPLAETLWEAYLYLTGNYVDYGRNREDRDLSIETGNSKSGNNSDYISAFQSVSSSERCDNSINIVLMTDGSPYSDSNRNSNIKKLYKNSFGSNPSAVKSSYLAALAQVIHGTDNVEIDLYPSTPTVHDTGRIFTIGFGSGMSSNGKELLAVTADYGGGQYLHADTADELSDVLSNTISRIREVNDSFISPSVASNNTDQTRSRDAIYFAMFYPETGARWGGNLKKLVVSGSEIVDSTGNNALDSNGLIDADAKTFWLPSGQPADGNAVAQGGVNLHLTNLDPESRNLYTDELGELVEFNTSVVSDILDLVTDNPLTLASSDIKWAMGVDVDDADKDGSTKDQRHDIFGDPLHSKPVAIDYGNNDVRILIGTNAGFLHMFKDSGNTINESWAFIPSALYDIIKPLRNNQADTKVYGMDGPISVYFDNKNSNEDSLNDGIIDATDGDEVWTFAGMRRGGNNYYALNITDPDNPKKLWDKPIEGGKGDFKELAQTWSKPQIAYIKAFGDKPLLIFGAGYDTNKDSAIRSEDSIGRGIYIVEAKTGKKVWALTPDENGFKGKHSIAADVTTLDSDYDGYIDRIYAADTGGDLWRIDMPGLDKNQFSHFKLAELGSDKATEDRRFFYKPFVARTMFSKVTETTVNGSKIITRLDTPYDAIVIGSGNRSKPTDTNEKDQLFMIRDENTVTESFNSKAPDTIKPLDLMLMNSDPFGSALTNFDKFVGLEADLAKYKGWRYELGVGEKSLAAATVVGGVAYFTSFTPASEASTKNQCSLSGGGGALYAFHLHYGTKVYDQLSFATSYDVPDTPQLYFGESPSCVDGNNDGKCDDNPTIDVTQESQFYLIGPGIKGNLSKNPLKPINISGPALSVVDGKIKLVDETSSIGFGFKTQQMYIYKREDNDEIND
ncbi:PilC/PilY family type IV pilus protein [Pseudoalteromonas aliena]|uniref:pilus assembly protein n=1 Tax=Pseudoalteromonas aliena TaxID=247523 RepID=UPI00311D2EC7